MITQLQIKNWVNEFYKKSKTTIMFTAEEWKIIEDALSREYSYCVMQTTRSRSFSKKYRDFREHKQQEERIKSLQEQWSKKADEVKDLIYKVDTLIIHNKNQRNEPTGTI
jgi:hypothetical protein